MPECIAHGVRIPGGIPGTPSDTVDDFERVLCLDVSWSRGAVPLFGTRIWESQEQNDSQNSLYSLFRERARYDLAVDAEGQGIVSYQHDRIAIRWSPNGSGPAHYLFGMGLAVWLEMLGIPVLHGNAFVIDGCAVGLLGRSGAGKTSATLQMLRDGAEFLADDFLPLFPSHHGWCMYPGLPQVRAWPSTVEGVLSLSANRLPRVHSNCAKRVLRLGEHLDVARCRSVQTLSALYIIERSSTIETPRVVRLKPVEALMALVSNSTAGATAIALKLEPERSATLAEVARKIPIMRLQVPNGLSQLSAIKEMFAL